MASATHKPSRPTSFYCATLLALLAVWTANAMSAPVFSKLFAPDTIGPGSVTTLTFTIDNTAGATTTDLAFTDALPAGVTVATPANASTTCLDGVVTAIDAGGSISLSGGRVGAGDTCTLMVDVTSSTAGTHMNVSGDLTSSAGSSGAASDDLMVVLTRPGFSKSFSPASVSLGGRSTLTFTIDNTANEGGMLSLDFTDILPTGMVIAGPSNASTDCGTPPVVAPTLTTVPGTSTISFMVNGTASFPAVGPGASCSVTSTWSAPPWEYSRTHREI